MMIIEMYKFFLFYKPKGRRVVAVTLKSSSEAARKSLALFSLMG